MGHVGKLRGERGVKRGVKMSFLNKSDNQVNQQDKKKFFYFSKTLNYLFYRENDF